MSELNFYNDYFSSRKDLSKLKQVHELTGLVKQLFTSDDLVKLARQILIPHYIITNPLTKEDTIWFIQAELIDWIIDNNLQYNRAILSPQIKFLEISTIKNIDKIPFELLSVANLFELPMEAIRTPSGIYFLCKNCKIQYIGQSVHIASRVSTHDAEGKKDFDSIFFIPIPTTELNEVEFALIKKYKPPLNGPGRKGELKEYQEIICKSLAIGEPIIIEQ